MTTGSLERDAEVVRAMKSVLNKLTVERFDLLFEQLTRCGIASAEHVEILMREVFDKATMQHHFIGMYASLCDRLHRWFVEESPVPGEGGSSFKRILLNRCQSSFEDSIRPPGENKQGADRIQSVQDEEEAEVVSKIKMLGNLKLIGALLQNGMLADKFLCNVAEELLSMATAASLECLTVFLTSVGPSFDRKEWQHHARLRKLFQKVRDVIQQGSPSPRIRFLLKDLLDLREASWKNLKKAVRVSDGPTTLSQVHQQAEHEEAAKLERSKTWNGGSAQWHGSGGWGGKGGHPGSGQQPSPSSSTRVKEKTASFDKAEYKSHLEKVLCQVQKTHSVKGAAEALSTWTVPAGVQAVELAEVLCQVAGWSGTPARAAGFELFAELVVCGHWSRGALSEGLSQFFGSFEDLVLDIPKLQSILDQELKPAVRRLMDAGFLEVSK